jgi:hypothetical protein
VINMKRRLLAAGTALAVLGLSAPARADISFGDLMEAADAIIKALIDPQVPDAELLMKRLEELLGVANTVPIGAPVIAYPVDRDAMVEFSTALQEDRKARVDAVDQVTAEYIADAPGVADALVALQAQNAAGPISVVAGQQINTEASLLMANEFSVQTAGVMALTRLENDRARQEIETGIRAREWQVAQNPNGIWAGRMGFAPTPYNLGY